MPVNKNAQFRYQILDRCFSDSMISVRQLRGDINAIRKMLPHGIYLDAKPYYDLVANLVALHECRKNGINKGIIKA